MKKKNNLLSDVSKILSSAGAVTLGMLRDIKTCCSEGIASTLNKMGFTKKDDSQSKACSIMKPPVQRMSEEAKSVLDKATAVTEKIEEKVVEKAKATLDQGQKAATSVAKQIKELPQSAPLQAVKETTKAVKKAVASKIKGEKTSTKPAAKKRKTPKA
jgi:hypothetical protein